MSGDMVVWDSLSDDLRTNKSEIIAYKNIGSRAVVEIGRRLKHVHDDLISSEHGAWTEFLSSIGMERRIAVRYINVVKNLKIQNGATSPRLGLTSLDLIASLPAEEQVKTQVLDSGEIKKPADMTVKELRKLKAELAESNKQNETLERALQDRNDELSDSNAKVRDLQERVPEKIEITKEVPPADYEDIKSTNAKVLEEIERTKAERDLYKQQAVEIANQRDMYAKDDKAKQRLGEDLLEMQSKIRKTSANLEAQKSFKEALNNVMSYAAAINVVKIRADLTFMDEDSPLVISLEEAVDRIVADGVELKQMLMSEDAFESDAKVLDQSSVEVIDNESK